MYSSDSDENSENELKNVLGSVLSGKMLAPSPAFQKALIGIQEQNRQHNGSLNFDSIDWDTLPEEINHTRSQVRSLLGRRYGRRQSIDDSMIGVKINGQRRGALLDQVDLDPDVILSRLKDVSLKKKF